MFKVRILIAFVMLVICSISDIKTGFINLWVIYISADITAVSELIHSVYTTVCLPQQNMDTDVSAMQNILACFNLSPKVYIGFGHILNGIEKRNLIFIIFTGLLLICIARETKQFGEGDVYIFIALEMMLSITSAMYIFLYAFISAGIITLILMINKKTSESIPFVPFVLTGFIMFYAKEIL